MPATILSDNGASSGTAGLKTSGSNDGILELQTTTGGGTATAAITIDTAQRSKFPTTIGVGGATPATSGSGISFPASASASSDANTLDDYEEGTFTATLTGGTTNPTTPVTSTSAYTKVGNVVNFKISFENVTTTGAAGQIQITGLPFTPANGYRVICPCVFYSIATFTGAPIGMIDNNLTSVYFYASDSSSVWTQVTHTTGSGRYLSVSGFYTV